MWYDVIWLLILFCCVLFFVSFMSSKPVWTLKLILAFDEFSLDSFEARNIRFLIWFHHFNFFHSFIIFFFFILFITLNVWRNQHQHFNCSLAHELCWDDLSSSTLASVKTYSSFIHLSCVLVHDNRLVKVHSIWSWIYFQFDLSSSNTLYWPLSWSLKPKLFCCCEVRRNFFTFFHCSLFILIIWVFFIESFIHSTLYWFTLTTIQHPASAWQSKAKQKAKQKQSISLRMRI